MWGEGGGLEVPVSLLSQSELCWAKEGRMIKYSKTLGLLLDGWML